MLFVGDMKQFLSYFACHVKHIIYRIFLFSMVHDYGSSQESEKIVINFEKIFTLSPLT